MNTPRTKIDMERIQSGGRLLWDVQLSLAGGGVSITVELTEEETSEGTDVRRLAALNAAAPVLEKMLFDLKQEIGQ